MQELQESLGEFMVEDKVEVDQSESDVVKEEYDLEIVETQRPLQDEPEKETPENEVPVPEEVNEPVHHSSSPANRQRAAQAKEMEQVMNQGLDFLSGMFKLANGKNYGLEGKKMEYDEEAGEVVMRFKLPDMKD